MLRLGYHFYRLLDFLESQVTSLFTIFQLPNMFPNLIRRHSQPLTVLLGYVSIQSALQHKLQQRPSLFTILEDLRLHHLQR